MISILGSRAARAGRARNSGVTLIELVISVTILSMVMLALLTLLSRGLRDWSAGTSQDLATSRATMALQRLCTDIRDGKSASVSSGALVVAFPIEFTDTDTGQTYYDPSGTDPYPRSYSISSGRLVRTVGGVTSVMGKDITTAAFGAAGGTVTVTLTCTEQVASHLRQRQVTGRVTLRNYRSM